MDIAGGLTNPPPVTTYLRKDFVVSAEPALITNLTLAASYNDGFVAYLNGHEIARRSMPEGAVNSLTMANQHAGGAFETIDLTAQKNRFRRGKNVLAVELHQHADGDIDFVWDAKLFYAASGFSSGTNSQPRIIEFGVDGAGVTLHWSSEAGRPYVQRSHDLSEWTTISLLIRATSATERFTDATLLTRGFYRVVLVE